MTEPDPNAACWRRVAQPLPADVASPVPSAGEPERARRVRAAIERLPDPEREVVQAVYLEATSTARVAALFGLTERAVEGRLRRARARLAGWLRGTEVALE